MPSFFLRWLFFLFVILSLAPAVNAFIDEIPGVRREIQKLREFDSQSLLDFVRRRKEVPTYESILEAVIEHGQAQDGTNDAQCGADINLIRDGLFASHKYSDLAFAFLDSSGKPGPGILRGRRNFMGFNKQCLAISQNVGNHTLEGWYFSIDFLIDFSDSISPADKRCGAGSPILWSLDVCLPKSCSSSLIYKSLYSRFKFTCNVYGIDYLNQDADVGTWITVAILVLILSLGITSSIYDFFIYPSHKNEAYTKTLGMKAWRSFSIYTNIVSIFNTKGHNKPGNIGPLHCMRFFSMFWVILGHSSSLFLAGSSNPLDTISIIKDWGTQVMTSAFYAVDTFFWQSGLLLSYIWVKKYYQNKRQATSPFAWVMFYVHRIVRLSPPYYILIIFYTFFFNKFIVHNMPIFNHMKVSEPCAKNWWIDFIYLNNFIRYDEQCYLVSWYLSTDLQMYLFAPLVLIPFTFGPLFGIVSALLILAVSTAVNVYTVLYHHFPPTDFAYAPRDPHMTTDYSFYTMMIYNAPWIRCQIYIIGILTGFLLQMKKKMKIPWYISVVGWLLTILIAGGCIFSLKDWISGHQAEIGWSATYSALSKIGWGLALSWITIACYYGYGGPINAFMSWSFWVPLGKLTYSTYLIHICVVVYFTGNQQQELIFTNFLNMLFMFVIPAVVTAYFFAIFWSSMFEISFGKLEDALISALLGSPRSRPPAPDAAANAIPPTPKPGDPDMSMGQIVDNPNMIATDKVSPEANGNGTNFGMDSLRKRNDFRQEIPTFNGNEKVATIRLRKLEEDAWG